MSHTALTPVFVGLRTGLHALFVALTLLVIARAALVPTDMRVTVIVLSVVLLVTYGLGGLIGRSDRSRSRLLRLGWLAVLTLLWVALLWLSSDAAYLVFPLFFLYLHLLGRWWGSATILVATGVAIYALGVHGGWTVGGVVGPLVGAGVALLIGLGYQALAREAEQREVLMNELINTRGQLAAIDHEAGVLAERARLAREIHDTLAQGLSSIQMLLHAAERADPDRAGIEHIVLARETAAENLADARRFIRELTPPQLDDRGLGGALRRLARTQWATQGLVVNVRVSDNVALPMHLQTALLRIAQGAIANVIQHAHASTATITLAVDQNDLRFTVVDDGTGFDPLLLTKDSTDKSDSFGLHATHERVQQLGGSLTLDTAPGQGTALAVNLSLEERP
ncbi:MULTISPECIES: sensor histidine kinase [Cryobacterium]|uniref:Sensor histidine kinase n=1 Tax=Cryobacterium breve TaxID=1259258 RepID=A0ABY2J4T4_9MICO|nr:MULTISPECIES: sensor histidine kinase [Cryobacterium]TFC93018.1 sensor histidine kinase [Cryobacterium sp. TmT3-12]TFC98865.1 sensor histidine kinase [Cryobacterium breve]